MQKHIKKSFPIFLLFIALTTFAVITPTTQAIWTQEATLGIWQYDTINRVGNTDYWITEYSVLTFNETVTDFSGYYMDYNISMSAIARQFYHTGNNEVIFGLGIYVGEDILAYARVRFSASTNLFGSDYDVFYGTDEKSDLNWGIPTGNPITRFRVAIVTTPEQITTVSYGFHFTQTTYGVEYTDVPHLASNETFTNSDLYRKNVTLKLYWAYAGSGTFDNTLTGYNEYTAGATPDNLDENHPVFGTETGLFAWINGAWTFISDLGAMATATFAVIFPIFPVLLFGWFFDALITSIATASIQPIGYVFQAIWEILKGALTAVVGFFQVVAEAIPL